MLIINVITWKRVSFTPMIFGELVTVALEFETWAEDIIWAEILIIVRYCVDQRFPNISTRPARLDQHLKPELTNPNSSCTKSRSDNPVGFMEKSIQLDRRPKKCRSVRHAGPDRSHHCRSRNQPPTQAWPHPSTRPTQPNQPRKQHSLHTPVQKKKKREGGWPCHRPTCYSPSSSSPSPSAPSSTARLSTTTPDPRLACSTALLPIFSSPPQTILSILALQHLVPNSLNIYIVVSSRRGGTGWHVRMALPRPTGITCSGWTMRG